MKNKNFWKNKIYYSLIFISIIYFTFFVNAIDWKVSLIIFGFSFYFLIVSFMVVKKHPASCDSQPFPKETPSVAIVTYAFNNFKPILKTIKSLKKLKYPKPYYIYVVTDGTCDFLKNVKGVKQIILPKEYFKKGEYINLKSKIINEGMKHIKEKNIFQVDGDTIPSPDALLKMTGTLKDNVAMVIGSVGVTNDNSFLEKLQTVEYNFGFGFPRMVLSAIDSLDIGTGAFCLYDRKKFLEVGGYDVFNITEDKELAYKFIENKYSVKFVVDAKSKTDVPNTWKGFFIQRIRWYRGGHDVTAKYSHLFFTNKLGYFNFYLIYNTLLLTIGMIFVAKTIWDFLSTFLLHLYYSFLNILQYGLEFSLDGFFKITLNPFINSLLILFIVSVSFGLYYVFITFNYNKFKIKKTHILPLIYMITIHGFILILISIISIIQGVFGADYKW